MAARSSSASASWSSPLGDTGFAYVREDRDGVPDGSGETPLIAAMRAYVASKFGETVELP